MLRTADLHKRFGSKMVLRAVSLHTKAGELVLIRGPNGAGKSTLLKLLVGLLEPTRGEISIDGFSMRTDAVKAKARLGYLPDGLDALPDLLASEFLELMQVLKYGSIDLASDDLTWRERLGYPSFAHQRLKSLSFGQRKRVHLLVALLGSPPLLILDEPTNGLDPEGVEQLHRLLESRKSSQLATVVASNDLGFDPGSDCTHYQLSNGELKIVPPLRTLL